MLRLFLCLLLVAGAYAETYSVGPNNSVQEAIESARPGDTVYLEDGIYFQSFDTARDGKPGSPITIEGSKGAIVKGDGRGRIIQVLHDYIHLVGFTVDGLNGDPNREQSYSNKLVYVQGTGERDGVDGLKVLSMTFMNSGGEALRLRYFVRDAEVAYNSFHNTGLYDFRFEGGGKNGEAIYVGTSSNQFSDVTNPTPGPDRTSGNWIHDNFFDTQGNECVDIKEGAYNNVVEYNTCTGQEDPNSGGLSARGDGNIIRYNEIYGNAGTGVRLGGHIIGNVQYGINNHVYANYIYNNSQGPVRQEAEPQNVHDNMYGPKPVEAVVQQPEQSILVELQTDKRNLFQIFMVLLLLLPFV